MAAPQLRRQEAGRGAVKASLGEGMVRQRKDRRSRVRGRRTNGGWMRNN